MLYVNGSSTLMLSKFSKTIYFDYASIFSIVYNTEVIPSTHVFFRYLTFFDKFYISMNEFMVWKRARSFLMFSVNSSSLNSSYVIKSSYFALCSFSFTFFMFVIRLAISEKLEKSFVLNFIEFLNFLK